MATRCLSILMMLWLLLALQCLWLCAIEHERVPLPVCVAVCVSQVWSLVEVQPLHQVAAASLS
jgi:hypothetical protein